MKTCLDTRLTEAHSFQTFVWLAKLLCVFEVCGLVLLAGAVDVTPRFVVEIVRVLVCGL